MIPASYHAYFSDAAEVAGTLIGLLFVAVSIDPNRFQSGDIVFRVRAAIAFSALINCLFVTLICLIPGKQLPNGGRALAIIGLVSCAWAAWISFGLVGTAATLRALVRCALLAAVFVFQLIACIDLAAHPHDTSPVSTIAYLVIAAFAIAIERSWELVGASGFSIVAMIERVTSRNGTDEVEVVSDEDVEP